VATFGKNIIFRQVRKLKRTARNTEYHIY